MNNSRGIKIKYGDVNIRNSFSDDKNGIKGLSNESNKVTQTACVRDVVQETALDLLEYLNILYAILYI